jgi:hypothetical protein
MSNTYLSITKRPFSPGRFAVAAASRNVCQCLVGAATSAVIEPMSRVMGNGWAYTTLAILFMLSIEGSRQTMRHGVRWRATKRENANL